ncbi:MAG: hypothetical protein JW747_07585 [Candidatus Aminicenantes bacterium]|nr:hypothetical protein [Candidatus Aminicenantes bacterium]
MSTQYYIEGFRSKTTVEEEGTRIFEFRQEFPSVEEASAKAREFFAKEEKLGLAVISKYSPSGDHEGVKFIFKSQEGQIEEGDLYWGDWYCREG